MPAQVISFVPRPVRSSDWSREELAELYRVEHALSQAGLAFDTDRGMSDEGDPWFVFSRKDGDVLVHISRFDGLYRLFSPGLTKALVGISFAELTKSFVSQVAAPVPMQRGNGARLFVHPSAMLAVIIGTIFVAFDDSHFLASHTQEAASEDSGQSQGQLRAEAGWFKAILQHAFQDYIEAFFGGERDDGGSPKFSFYLNIISTVTAFVLSSILSSVDSLAKLDIVASSSVEDGSHNSNDGNHLGFDVASLDNATHVTADNKASVDHLPTVETDQQLVLTTQQGVHFETNVAGSDASRAVPTINEPEHVAEPEAVIGDHMAAVVLDAGFTVKAAAPVSHDAVPTLNVVADLGTSSSSGSVLSLLQQDGVSSFTIAELAHLQVSTFSQLPSDAQSVITQVLSDQAAPGFDLVSANSSVTSLSDTSDPVVLQVFHLKGNGDGQAALVAFLQSNPNAEAVMQGKNVIVYDGAIDTSQSHHQTTVQVVELDASGTSIVLVGHTDHPAAALMI